MNHDAKAMEALKFFNPHKLLTYANREPDSLQIDNVEEEDEAAEESPNLLKNPVFKKIGIKRLSSESNNTSR